MLGRCCLRWITNQAPDEFHWGQSPFRPIIRGRGCATPCAPGGRPSRCGLRTTALMSLVVVGGTPAGIELPITHRASVDVIEGHPRMNTFLMTGQPLMSVEV